VVLINPEMVVAQRRDGVAEEGCLSVPQIYDKVERHAASRCVRWTATAALRDGSRGPGAVCVQHEMDHLLGKVFVEYLSPLKRDRIRTKMLKKARDERAARDAAAAPAMRLRVAFAGTPEFARRRWQAMHEAGTPVPLVLTQPDRPAGRGLKLQASPVKQLALARGLPVAQPRSLRLDGKLPDDARGPRRAGRRRARRDGGGRLRPDPAAWVLACRATAA
jgi:hypothetical protein